MANKAFGFFVTSISAEAPGVRPSIVVEIVTDQGVVASGNVRTFSLHLV
jgi:hypothetical protein